MWLFGGRKVILVQIVSDIYKGHLPPLWLILFPDCPAKFEYKPTSTLIQNFNSEKEGPSKEQRQKYHFWVE